MLSQILVSELLDLANNRKIQGTFSETGYEPDKRHGIGKQTGNFTNCKDSLFHQKAFNGIRIGIIAYTDRNQK